MVKSHETVPLRHKKKNILSAHLSGILPLCGLGDMVHEVDLSVGSLRHLPAGRQVVCDVIALLTQVLQLVALKNKKNKNLRISS